MAWSCCNVLCSTLRNQCHHAVLELDILQWKLDSLLSWCNLSGCKLPIPNCRSYHIELCRQAPSDVGSPISCRVGYYRCLHLWPISDGQWLSLARCELDLHLCIRVWTRVYRLAISWRDLSSNWYCFCITCQLVLHTCCWNLLSIPQQLLVTKRRISWSDLCWYQCNWLCLLHIQVQRNTWKDQRLDPTDVCTRVIQE